MHPALVDHQADMIRRCPYLGPSVQRGLTVWSAYRAEPGDQPGLFALLVQWAEELRTARREAGPLACRNMVGRFWVGVRLDDSKGEPMLPPTHRVELRASPVNTRCWAIAPRLGMTDGRRVRPERCGAD